MSREPMALLATYWLLLVFPSSAAAGVCSVPGSHPTIQQAIDDLLCTDIQLAANTYPENFIIDRSLMLSGPPEGGAVVLGQGTVVGVGTAVTLANFRIENGCSNFGLFALLGAEVVGQGIQFVVSSDLPCTIGMLFSNGFEG